MKRSSLTLSVALLTVAGLHEAAHQFISRGVCRRIVNTLPTDPLIKVKCKRTNLFGSALIAGPNSLPGVTTIGSLELSFLEEYFVFPISVYIDYGDGFLERPDFRLLLDDDGRVVKGDRHPADSLYKNSNHLTVAVPG